ncbi:hypothetical protein EJ110_NYTH59555 [Nymphaea thermarum]|nr:hypothetical protein EJ110_NYTH59555 [Nymphaea thermarum]
MVWIVGTLSQDIANEVLHKESAKDMWDSLAATYSHARNETKIMQLHHDIHQMRQDGRPIHAYYSILKSMFERLNSYFPACKCEQQKAYRDMLMVGVFLSGLDSVYESAKNQMLTSPSIPPIDEAYSRLSRISISAATVPDTTSAMLVTLVFVASGAGQSPDPSPTRVRSPTRGPFLPRLSLLLHRFPGGLLCQRREEETVGCAAAAAVEVVPAASGDGGSPTVSPSLALSVYLSSLFHMRSLLSSPSGPSLCSHDFPFPLLPCSSSFPVPSVVTLVFCEGRIGSGSRPGPDFLSSGARVRPFSLAFSLLPLSTVSWWSPVPAQFGAETTRGRVGIRQARGPSPGVGRVVTVVSEQFQHSDLGSHTRGRIVRDLQGLIKGGLNEKIVLVPSLFRFGAETTRGRVGIRQARGPSPGAGRSAVYVTWVRLLTYPTGTGTGTRSGMPPVRR